MPYKSKKQAAYMHIHHPDIAAKWDREGAKVEEETDHPSVKEIFAVSSQLKEEEEKTCPNCEQGHHERCRDKWCDCCKGEYKTPKLTEVFVVEAPIQNRPPPGSQMVHDPEYNKMGQVGQSLKKGKDALKAGGNEVTVYKTPAGQMIGYPKDAAPGRGPVQADMTKGGLWQPMTGSAAGVPSDPLSNTTTMK